MLAKEITAKYEHLKHIISNADSVLMAFSGGVDSTFLLAVCIEVLDGSVLAVTADSELLPRHERDQAIAMANHLGARHLVIKSNDLDLAGVIENTSQRCYFCKKERFIQLKQIAMKEQLKWVFDGSNVDDLKDYRPGMKAVKELGVRSPLVEANLSKADIRELSRFLGLATWNQPSAACLGTRIPYHTKITRSALQQIEKAEKVLREMGMEIYRVRHFDDLARLELGENEMRSLLDKKNRDRIVQEFSRLGYQTVAVDLKGYRMGSMNTFVEESKS